MQHKHIPFCNTIDIRLQLKKPSSPTKTDATVLEYTKAIIF